MLELLALTKTGLEVYKYNRELNCLETVTTIENVETYITSNNGECIVIIIKKCIKVYKDITDEPIFSVNYEQPIEKVEISADNEVLLVVTKYISDEQNNIIAYNISNNNVLHTGNSKRIYNNFELLTINSIKYIIYIRKGNLVVISLDENNGSNNSYNCGNIINFKCNNVLTNNCLLIGTYSLNPCVFNLLQVNVSKNKFETIYLYKYNKVDDLELYWNSEGNYLAIKDICDIDRTATNYYGISGLKVISIVNKQTNEALLNVKEITLVTKKDGPIQFICWANKYKLLIGFGKLPCQMNLYDFKNKGNNMTLGRNRRNYIVINKNICCIAGVANLTGNVDIWDLDKGELIGTCRLDCSVSLEISPDCYYLLSTTTAPRLLEDNKIRISKINGELLLTQQFTVLYKASWRPAIVDQITLNSTEYITILSEKKEQTNKLSMSMLLNRTFTTNNTDCELIKKFEPLVYEPDVIPDLPVGMTPSMITNKSKFSRRPKSSNKRQQTAKAGEAFI